MLLVVILVVISGVAVTYPYTNSLLIADAPIQKFDSSKYWGWSKMDEHERFLARKMSAANYCEIADDCKLVPAYCPLGCGNYVHKSNYDSTLLLLEEKIPNCVYDCGPPVFVRCVKNRCVGDYP